MDGVREVKLCLLGDSGVGKSSIANRFVNNIFTPGQESTIGAAFLQRTVILDNNNAFKYNIWDTAGQERYRSLAPMYYRGAGAAIIVYDITVYKSFESVKSWIRELQVHGPVDLVMAIAGNKADLEDRREVPFAAAKKFADDIGALFIETSARTALNIEQLFVDISRKVPKKKDEPIVHGMELNPKPAAKSKKCC